jgi:hypothetical protein
MGEVRHSGAGAARRHRWRGGQAARSLGRLGIDRGKWSCWASYRATAMARLGLGPNQNREKKSLFLIIEILYRIQIHLNSIQFKFNF